MNNPQTQLDKLRHRLTLLTEHLIFGFFPTREEKDQIRERVEFLKNQIRLAELVEANKSRLFEPGERPEHHYQDNDQLPF